MESYRDLIVSLTTILYFYDASAERKASSSCACAHATKAPKKHVQNFLAEALSSSFKSKSWAKTVQVLCFASAKKGQRFFSFFLTHKKKDFFPSFLTFHKFRTFTLSAHTSEADNNWESECAFFNYQWSDERKIFKIFGMRLKIQRLSVLLLKN